MGKDFQHKHKLCLSSQIVLWNVFIASSQQFLVEHNQCIRPIHNQVHWIFVAFVFMLWISTKLIARYDNNCLVIIATSAIQNAETQYTCLQNADMNHSTTKLKIRNWYSGNGFIIFKINNFSLTLSWMFCFRFSTIWITISECDTQISIISSIVSQIILRFSIQFENVKMWKCWIVFCFNCDFVINMIQCDSQNSI